MHNTYLMPQMTLMEFGEDVSSIKDFQLLCSEKHLRTISHTLLHCAASIGSNASFILSSRFQAHKTIVKMISSTTLARGKNIHKNCVEDSIKIPSYHKRMTLVFEKKFSLSLRSLTSNTSLSNSKIFWASRALLLRYSCVKLWISLLVQDFGKHKPMWSKFSVWNLISICHGE